MLELQKWFPSHANSMSDRSLGAVLLRPVDWT